MRSPTADDLLRGLESRVVVHTSPGGFGLCTEHTSALAGSQRRAHSRRMTPEQCAAQRQIDLAATIRGLTLADAVGLALRDHRRRLGLSQRAYARLRSKTPSSIARLESSAGCSQLKAVIEALDGTGFELALVRPGDEDTGSTPAAIVGPDAWPMTELLARVRDGSRRFPAHHEAQAVVSPPSWWWHREFFAGRPGPEPQWYAPRPTPQEPYPLRSDTA